MNFLSRLKLWQKLAVLVVAMAIPSALLGVFYLGGANSQVALAKDEIEGAKYVQALGGMLAEAANHRSRLSAIEIACRIGTRSQRQAPPQGAGPALHIDPVRAVRRGRTLVPRHKQGRALAERARPSNRSRPD